MKASTKPIIESSSSVSDPIRPPRFFKQPGVDLEKHRATLKREVNRAIMLNAYSRHTMLETQALMQRAQELTSRMMQQNPDKSAMNDDCSADECDLSGMAPDMAVNQVDPSLVRSLELHRNSQELLAKNKFLLERTASISRYKVDKDGFEEAFVKNIFCF